MDTLFENRTDAGRQLAQALGAYAGRSDLIVLALPRGGVPVAYEVARALKAPLDLLIVRKLGTPGNPELAMGAIASGGASVLNRDVVSIYRISDEVIENAAAKERQELERRERLYRGDRPYPDIENRCIIVVDDGIATGATMRAGLAALRQRNPACVVVAVPLAPVDTVERLRAEVDEVVCLMTPEPFFAVGQGYRDFSQTTDDEVREILTRAWGETSD
ncbi:MAG: phosphoribosyltransferase [Methylocaldum sp.]|jgi:putative phosphoribosyl transferase|uniref:phosphoribosyltransferase n=1 Tax=Methylocaldum sp. 14B TaxID=1912213 RepID=UPI00098B6F6B|nr:phosphoribosyltransferase [Methylocaldum sp. 14B]MDV3240452.1 phosphoribosyltransferase [Methylocaldum sp.]